MKLAGAALLALLTQVAAPSWAQGSGIGPAPPANSECVKPEAGALAMPVYPEDAYRSKIGGTVRIEMEFAGPDSSPKIRTLANDSADAFSDAVRRHAARYRNTCMKPGDPPVRLQQDFVFVPNDARKVSWTIASDGKDGAFWPTNACATHIAPGSKPEYPKAALRVGATARILAQVTFEAIGEQPKVTLRVPGPRADLARAVQEFAEGYRLTCGQPPIVATQMFVFRMSDETRILADTTLVAFLRGTRNAGAKPVFFDLDSMSCPFDVRLEYWQPSYRNRVGEVGTPVPARKPFLDWLSTLVIRADDKLQNAVLGETTTISVPCGKIDL